MCASPYAGSGRRYRMICMSDFNLAMARKDGDREMLENDLERAGAYLSGLKR